jgi:DNA-binding transcriptional MocR family regulator
MDLDLEVKLAIYHHFAESTRRPSPHEIADRLQVEHSAVLDAYQRLRAQRVLVLEEDGASIRMAPPFSGVPTQHVAEVEGRRYFANCAWDVFGIIAALQKPGIAHSRCEQTREPLRLSLGPEGPEASDWRFHCLVPAAHWWDDIVFT